MNRDPSKIIVIDWNEDSYSLQPRNALHRLKNWDGDENDTDLIYLASLLKSILYNYIELFYINIL
jgi:TFIIF-interacting CTD phosphatase-like protein